MQPLIVNMQNFIDRIFFECFQVITQLLVRYFCSHGDIAPICQSPPLNTKMLLRTILWEIKYGEKMTLCIILAHM